MEKLENSLNNLLKIYIFVFQEQFLMGNLCVLPSKLDRKSILDTTQVSYVEQEPYFKKEAERIEIQSDSDSLANKKIALTDFIKIKVLGIGAFGRVVLVKKKDSSNKLKKWEELKEYINLPILFLKRMINKYFF